MPYRSCNVMIQTGSMIRRNRRYIVSNPQQNSSIIDEVPLEDPTIVMRPLKLKLIKFLFQLIVMPEILSIEVEKYLGCQHNII